MIVSADRILAAVDADPDAAPIVATEDSDFRLTQEEVAVALGVCVGTVKRWTKQGRLPRTTTPRGYSRYKESEIIELRDGSLRMHEPLEISINALGQAAREPAFALLAAARVSSWHGISQVEETLAALTDEIHRLKDRVAAATVDKDRGIRAAGLRAEDCTQHGADLRHERHQSYYFSRLADQRNDERIVWLAAVQRLRDALATVTDWPGAAKVLDFLDAADRGAKRIRDRNSAPSLADCQRAGRCAHPAPLAHTACRQLELPIEVTS